MYIFIYMILFLHFFNFFFDVLVKTSKFQDKITCEPGDVLIGNFEGNSYTFSCCAGAQCGGCRRNKNGECLECAAGYVHQVILSLRHYSIFLRLVSHRARSFPLKAQTDFERYRFPISVNMCRCISIDVKYNMYTLTVQTCLTHYGRLRPLKKMSTS